MRLRTGEQELRRGIHGLKSRDYELGTNIKRFRAGDQVMGTRR